MAPLVFHFAVGDGVYSNFEMGRSNLKYLAYLDVKLAHVVNSVKRSEFGMFDKECVDSLGNDVFMVAIKRNKKKILEDLFEFHK